MTGRSECWSKGRWPFFLFGCWSWRWLEPRRRGMSRSTGRRTGAGRGWWRSRRPGWCGRGGSASVRARSIRTGTTLLRSRRWKGWRSVGVWRRSSVCPRCYRATATPRTRPSIWNTGSSPRGNGGRPLPSGSWTRTGRGSIPRNMWWRANRYIHSILRSVSGTGASGSSRCPPRGKGSRSRCSLTTPPGGRTGSSSGGCSLPCRRRSCWWRSTTRSAMRCRPATRRRRSISPRPSRPNTTSASAGGRGAGWRRIWAGSGGTRSGWIWARPSTLASRWSRSTTNPTGRSRNTGWVRPRNGLRGGWRPPASATSSCARMGMRSRWRRGTTSTTTRRGRFRWCSGSWRIWRRRRCGRSGWSFRTTAFPWWRWIK